MKRYHQGALLAALLLPTAALAVVDNGLVDGEHGVLHVFGALSESPCRLDMASAWQDVALGITETATLGKVGDRGVAVPVQLRLRDCLRPGSDARDRDSGNLSWSATQPVATVTFEAPADVNNPQLLRASGVSGLGLRLLDAKKQPVRTGSRSRSQWLTPGENQLTYYVQPERTAAPLEAGAYRAVIHFRMSYD